MSVLISQMIDAGKWSFPVNNAQNTRVITNQTEIPERTVPFSLPLFCLAISCFKAQIEASRTQSREICTPEIREELFTHSFLRHCAKTQKKSESNFLFSLTVFFESTEFVIILPCLCFGFLTKKHVGSWLLDQGSRICPPCTGRPKSGLEHQGSPVVFKSHIKHLGKKLTNKGGINQSWSLGKELLVLTQNTSKFQKEGNYEGNMQ